LESGKQKDSQQNVQKSLLFYEQMVNLKESGFIFLEISTKIPLQIFILFLKFKPVMNPMHKSYFPKMNEILQILFTKSFYNVIIILLL